MVILGIAVLSDFRIPLLLSLLLIPIGCANSPNAQSLQQAIQADPRLTSSSTPSASPSPSPSSTLSSTPTPSPSPTASDRFTDLTQVPNQLQPYLKDILALDVISPSNDLSLIKNITRREYAHWLVAVNNRLYATTPAKQIRLATPATPPVFQDVPSDDVDFPAIQGLAEAGLIPSPLSGDSTATLFRPNAALTREDLILWKVPIDTRQALPTATIDSIQQTWGFQDASKIAPKALRAIYMDFQNSDQSNIRRAFGYTTLFQPKRPVTRAEAIAALWYVGFQGDGISAKEALKGITSPSSPAPTVSPST